MAKVWLETAGGGAAQTQGNAKESPFDEALGFLGPIRRLVFGVQTPFLTGILLWRDVFESHVRPGLIVIASPGFDGRFRVRQRFEPMQVQAFVAQ